MKKKLFIFVCIIALIFAGTICLTACGGNNKGVDLFNKTYVFSGQATYSIMDSNGNKVDGGNWEQWITDNYGENGFNYGSNINGLNNINSATDLINYIKNGEYEAELVSEGHLVILKNAKIEIGEGIKTDNGSEKKGSFKITWGEDQRIDTTEIVSINSHTEYEKYYCGEISGGNFSGTRPDGFELTDYDEKSGTIRDAKVAFRGSNKDYYTISVALSINQETTSRTIMITYALSSVS